MDTLGKHLTMDLWYSELDDVEIITDQICQLVDKTYTVVKKCEHQFNPHGRTIVYILSESHFTVHTYPESNYLSLDIYICNMDHRLSELQKKITELSVPVKLRSNINYRGF